MSVAPIISPESTRAATPGARPKRITPPAHWKDTPPAAAPKKIPAKAVVPVVVPAAAPAPSAMLSRGLFIALLLLGVVALNALLLWLFPLPELQAGRRSAPAFSPAPTAEESELPVWLRP